MKIHELGHVVLYVTSLERSADFYKNILGFEELHRDTHTALFSSGRTHHELLLIEIGGEVVPEIRLRPGLYHIGFKIGNHDDDLRNALDELMRHGIEIVGTANHHVTHSLYILDPDGNELELYIDVNDVWKQDKKAILKPVERLIL
jgi:catechol-2,3-dioxygenase